MIFKPPLACPLSLSGTWRNKWGKLRYISNSNIGGPEIQLFPSDQNDVRYQTSTTNDTFLVLLILSLGSIKDALLEEISILNSSEFKVYTQISQMVISESAYFCSLNDNILKQFSGIFLSCYKQWNEILTSKDVFLVHICYAYLHKCYKIFLGLVLKKVIWFVFHS